VTVIRGMGWDGMMCRVILRFVWEPGRFGRCTLVSSGIRERCCEFVIDEYKLQQQYTLSFLLLVIC